MSQYLVEVKGLTKYFDVSKRWFGREKSYLKAVDGLDFHIDSGETLGLVGESGCGKSTTGNLIVRLLQPTSGQVFFKGEDIGSLSLKELRTRRPGIQMVFQDPYSSLNPRMRLFDIIAEPLIVHKREDALERKVFDLMDAVGLNRGYARRFSHEFSGGQRQRIGIARALALRPDLVICDEPVSALDVSIQAQILGLLKQLQKEFNLTYLFISHGLPGIKYISTRIAVMYLGKIVEIAEKEELFARPLHPYTEGLLSAVPVPDPKLREKGSKKLLEGDIPSPAAIPSGCRFHTRCRYIGDICKNEPPALREISHLHRVACHFPLKEYAC